MQRLWRWCGVLAMILLFATAAGAAIPRFGLELLAPHAARRSAAQIDPELRKAIDAGLAKAPVGSVTEVLNFSLAVTDKLLHFGLEHPQSLAFAAVEREGNCIEYAHLFARVFERAAAKGGVEARAYVVHSAKAQVFGQAVPLRGWGDHDWVLIEAPAAPGESQPQRWYVDPTMHDAGLGWDVSANVRGEITLTRRGE